MKEKLLPITKLTKRFLLYREHMIYNVWNYKNKDEKFELLLINVIFNGSSVNPPLVVITTMSNQE